MSTNPYQTPEGQLTIDDQAVGEIKFFSPSSRINRLRYWAHSMLFTFAMIAAFTILGLVAVFISETVGIVLGVITYIAMVVFSFILIIQRLHDLNKTGWLSLLALIPLANIYLLVLLIFFKGTEGRNNYGLQTPPNKTWHWILAFSLPVLLIVIGILAAVALPAYQSYLELGQDANSSYSSPDSGAEQSEYQEEGAAAESMYTDGEDDASQASEEQVLEDEALDAAEAELLEEAESNESVEAP